MRAATDFQLPNGKTLVIPESSADLESEDFAVYVTQVEAALAERGVFLSEMKTV